MPLRRLDRVNSTVKGWILALLVIGAAGVAVAWGVDATRAWRAYLFNWLFWASLAQGAVVFSAAVTMARGIWSRPVRRIALSFVAFVPISLVLLIPLLLAGGEIFPWIGEDLHGKEAYLNLPFLTGRNLVLLVAMTGVSLLYAYWALRPDLGLLRDSTPARLRPLYDRMTKGWRGQEAEEAFATRRLAIYGPIMALVWAFAYSIVAYDFVMSLESHWFSTMIGPLFFMAGFLGGVAATAVLTAIYRKTLDLGDYIQTPQFHDLGKLTFAFCAFWAYLYWGQFVTIWYGMLPHEQTFLVHRFSSPYSVMSTISIVLLFVIPFCGLLGAMTKRSPTALAIFAAVALVGLWFERYVLVYPSYPEYQTGGVVFGWQEIAFALPFAGLMLLSLMYFATRFPLLQIWEPLVEQVWLESTEDSPGTEAVTLE
jgi:Ni/Fe-hydrogenase subunit HybB-like protein